MKTQRRSGGVPAVCLLLALAATSALAQVPSGVEVGKPGEEEEQRERESPEGEAAPGGERKVIQAWNEYDFRLLTFKWGLYSLVDWGTAYQDLDSVEQVGKFRDSIKIRDLRFTFKGKLATQRSITYTMGVMFDGLTNTWFPRETGVQVAIPELWGNVFVGRQKVGVSLNRISNGYAVWMMERMPINDAAVPVLADGIKWLGVHPSKRANWTLAYFHNTLPKNPAKGVYDDEVVARLAFLPKVPDKDGALLHFGGAYHWGRFSDGEARFRSRPESSTAPYFLETGTFAANLNHMVGLEAYFQRQGWTLGAEYVFNQIRSAQTGNPVLHGGEAFVAWVISGESRPYEDIGGRIGFLTPTRSAFEGGMGAVEPVLHLSYTDFDDGGVHGGRLWRLTPHVNWYLDDHFRLEFNYGLGMLDKDGRRGFTHFFQGRLMVMVQ